MLELLHEAETGDPTVLPEIRAKLEAAPEDPALLEWYAHSLYSCRHHDESIKVYDRLLKIEPSNLQWLLYRANALFIVGQHERARDGWMEILEYSPDSRIGRRAQGLLKGERPKESETGQGRPGPPRPPPTPRVADGPVRTGQSLSPGGRRHRGLVLVGSIAGIALAFYALLAPGPPAPVASPSAVVSVTPTPSDSASDSPRARRRRARIPHRPAPPKKPPGHFEQEVQIRQIAGMLILVFVSGVLLHAWFTTPPRR
ncbi:MAG: hypothetical protein HY815_18005 [Candidatus Riflebacteria bacterium]|nr:hypothetical protein [Candidatus Riflebacteria bacterium]